MRRLVYNYCIIKLPGYFRIKNVQGHIASAEQPICSNNISIADLVKDIKRSSNNWINDKEFIVGKFEWQTGYGAFSYGKSQID